MDLIAVMTSLTRSKELRQFWVKCVDSTVLYINAEKFLAHLERSFGDVVREKYEVSASTGELSSTHTMLRLMSTQGDYNFYFTNYHVLTPPMSRVRVSVSRCKDLFLSSLWGADC